MTPHEAKQAISDFVAVGKAMKKVAEDSKDTAAHYIIQKMVRYFDILYPDSRWKQNDDFLSFYTSTFFDEKIGSDRIEVMKTMMDDALFCASFLHQSSSSKSFLRNTTILIASATAFVSNIAHK